MLIHIGLYCLQTFKHELVLNSNKFMKLKLINLTNKCIKLCRITNKTIVVLPFYL